MKKERLQNLVAYAVIFSAAVLLAFNYQLFIVKKSIRTGRT